MNPRRTKSEHTGSAFVNKAAKQVASALRKMTDSQLSHRRIENILRQFDSETAQWSRPIHAIVFVSDADTESELGKQYCYDVIVVSWSSESYSTSSHVVSLEVFARKVREFLK